MGSSSSGAVEYVGWEKSERCSCSEDNYVIEKISIRRVPISKRFLTGINKIEKAILDFVTLGTSTTFHGFRSLEHDCVELKIRCKKCGKIMYMTIELNQSNSIETCFGYYSIYEIRRERSIYVDYRRAKNALPTSNYYDLVDRNCSHYAVEAYNAIINA